jgi:hypothetical protein
MKMTLVFLALLSTLCFAKSKPVKISTMIWPPYVDQHKVDNGIIPHIVKRVFEKTTHTSEIEIIDWITVSRQAETTQYGYSAYMPETYPKLMSDDFICSDSVLDVPMLLLGRPSTPLSLLRSVGGPLIMGAVSEYPLDKTEVFLRKRFSHLIFYDFPTERSLIKNLIDGTIDFVYIDSLMLHQLLTVESDLNERRSDFNTLLIVGNRSIYVCFNKPSYETLLVFNKALSNVDTLDILYKYLPSFSDVVRQ